MNKKMLHLTQTGSVALGVGCVGEACLNLQASDMMQFIETSVLICDQKGLEAMHSTKC